MNGFGLVADIGGTNARFAIARKADGAITLEHRETFQVEHYEHVADAAKAYLESWDGDRPRAATFAVAAPIKGDSVRFTSSSWAFGREALQGSLGLQALHVINDFEAQALGVRQLPPGALKAIKPGQAKPTKPAIVFGPGTGLGLSLLVPTQTGEEVISTEGGHVAFAPGTDKEIEVLKFIRAEHGYVSYERLLSGRGLVNIHRALCVMAGQTRVSLAPSEITEAALSKSLPIATEAVEMFCALLGAYAGDAVLLSGGQGGVFIAGGIVPRVSSLLLGSDFVKRFTERGPMSGYVKDVPVQVVMSDEAAFLGAARLFLE